MTCNRQRNPRELEPHYSRHMAALTAENLYSKGDIAAELAVRDQTISVLVETLRQAVGGVGYLARTAGTHIQEWEMWEAEARATLTKITSLQP